MKEIAFADTSQLREAQSEATMMKEIKNRYVTQYVDSFVQGHNLYLIMEYC